MLWYTVGRITFSIFDHKFIVTWLTGHKRFITPLKGPYSTLCLLIMYNLHVKCKLFACNPPTLIANLIALYSYHTPMPHTFRICCNWKPTMNNRSFHSTKLKLHVRVGVSLVHDHPNWLLLALYAVVSWSAVKVNIAKFTSASVAIACFLTKGER